MKRRLFIVAIAMLWAGQSGAQWIQSSLGDAQYGYNIFSDSVGVWSATLNGVYHTTDTGNPWFSRGLTSRLVFDVITSGPYILAATEGTGPGVYRSSDNGANWVAAAGMTNQSVRAFTKNSSWVFACTWGGGVFRSSDNGATWQSTGLTNHGFRSMFAVGERVFAGGDNIFFSTDNGSSWTGRTLPFPAGDTWCFAYLNGKLYAGDMGLYQSEDLGLTWKLVYGVTFDGTGTPKDIIMFQDLATYGQTLIAALSPGAIALSRDYGSTWDAWNEGLISDWTLAGLAVRPPYIWALTKGFGNAYLRPLSQVTTAAVESPDEAPAGFRLIGCFPNPFNPATVVRYQLPAVSEVKLGIFDLLGREVAMLVDARVEAGMHEATFDAAGLPTGVYLCRFRAGGFSAVEKLVLAK